MATEIKTETPRGRDLAIETAQWVTDQYELALSGQESEWDQAAWCGTRRCVAGYIVQRHGWSSERDGSDRIVRDGVTSRTSEVATELLVGPDPSAGEWEKAARLYWATNDLLAVWEGFRDIWPDIEIPGRVYVLTAGGPPAPPSDSLDIAPW